MELYTSRIISANVTDFKLQDDLTSCWMLSFQAAFIDLNKCCVCIDFFLFIDLDLLKRILPPI